MMSWNSSPSDKAWLLCQDPLVSFHHYTPSLSFRTFLSSQTHHNCTVSLIAPSLPPHRDHYLPCSQRSQKACCRLPRKSHSYLYHFFPSLFSWKALHLFPHYGPHYVCVFSSFSCVSFSSSYSFCVSFCHPHSTHHFLHYHFHLPHHQKTFSPPDLIYVIYCIVDL